MYFRWKYWFAEEGAGGRFSSWILGCGAHGFDSGLSLACDYSQNEESEKRGGFRREPWGTGYAGGGAGECGEGFEEEDLRSSRITRALGCHEI